RLDGDISAEMVVAALQKREASVESACGRILLRLEAEMPLAGKDRLIAGGSELFRKRRDVGPQVSFIIRLADLVGLDHLRHRAETREMVRCARQQHRPRRRAGRRRMEIRQTDTSQRKRVEVWRIDLAAKG